MEEQSKQDEFKEECEAELRAAVPAVTALTAEEIEAASSRELRFKMGEYEEQATKLLEYFTQVYASYEVTEATYDSVFAKVDSIRLSLDVLVAGRPGVDVDEAFEEILTFIDIGKYASIGGGAFGFINTGRKIRKFIKARNAASRAHAISKLAGEAGRISIAEARAVQVAGLSRDISKIRRGAMYSGVFSTLVSGAGIALMVHEENLLKKQFAMNLPQYDEWFRLTETKAVEFCSTSKLHRRNIENLKDALDVSTEPEAGETQAETYARTDAVLKARLDEIGRSGGEFEAIIESASRALCLDVSVSDVLLYSGLPNDAATLQFLSDRQTMLLADNKAQCRALYPDLNLP